jgi:hypothetical protein
MIAAAMIILTHSTRNLTITTAAAEKDSQDKLTARTRDQAQETGKRREDEDRLVGGVLCRFRTTPYS